MSSVSLMAKLPSQKAVVEFLNRTRHSLTGLAQDLWKDGKENPFRPQEMPPVQEEERKHYYIRPEMPATALPQSPQWHALPGEISEIMWGEGAVTPGADVLFEMLTKPLGLNRQMSVLDLSAGLGRRMRRVTEEFGVYVTGLEPDAGIAARGMQMSAKEGKGKQDVIEHYRPATFKLGTTVTRSYDCIIARETFYRVPDKETFISALAVCTKPQAQISFTDYIVNPEDRNNPGVVAWMNYEKDATPLSLIEMAEIWAKEEFRLRVNDDQSDFYRKEVLQGLKRFAAFLATGIRPDPDTRQAILRRMEIWAHRLGAMEQGMKFVRFYGTK